MQSDITGMKSSEKTSDVKPATGWGKSLDEGILWRIHFGDGVVYMNGKDGDIVTIGDLNSSEKGTGARKSFGKAHVELVNWRSAVNLLKRSEANGLYLDCLYELGCFQETHDTRYLQRIASHLYGYGLEHIGIQEAADVLEFGRHKYAAWNWAKGMPWSIPVGCIARHLIALYEGQELDPESGKKHKGHVMCNILMLVEFSLSYPEGNDLPTVWLTNGTF